MTSGNRQSVRKGGLECACVWMMQADSETGGHAVAQWPRRRDTHQEVAGSKLDELDAFFFNLPNPSGRTKPLRVTQSLAEMSTRDRNKRKFLGSRAWPVCEANLTTIFEPIV
jgi:hypothetical protein